MNLPADLFSGPILWLGNAVYLLLLIVAVRGAAWWHLRDSEDTHVFLATCVGLLLAWHVKAGVLPGLTLHQLGATLATLMFGWRFALIAISLVLAGSTVYGAGAWLSFGWNALLMGGLPVAVSYTVFRLADRFLPNNFFVYVFVGAFFGAALAILGTGAASTILLWAAGAYPADVLVQQYAVYYLLMIFPEAFVTGALMSIFVVYRPAWVNTFDDARYLRSDRSAQG